MSGQFSSGSSPVLENTTVTQKRADLRAAVRDCRTRGLYQAAKWASEQLAGGACGVQEPDWTCRSRPDQSHSRRFCPGLPAEAVPEERSATLGLSEEDSDSLLLARTLFDARVARHS